MLNIFRLLLLSINIDQETVLNWFGIENSNSGTLLGENPSLSNIELELAPSLSLETLKLIIEGLWDKIQDGLSLSDIDHMIFFILFIRFVILAIRYNLKTSFYITCIGIFAGYLWYRHLIDVIGIYRNALLNIPFLSKVGVEIVQTRSFNRKTAITDFKLYENVHWYNPLKLIYYAFKKGIVNVDPETGLRYYIDPISMIVSNLNEPARSIVVPIYYQIYNEAIPKLYKMLKKSWSQLSLLLSYTLITRIGKRYCPYLIRWHWTFIIILGVIEPVILYFTYRMYHFQKFVLIPQLHYGKYLDQNMLFQVNLVTALISCMIFAHLGLTLFGLFHAICGQYFYIPFMVETVELHVGPRPKHSIYSGGQTAWQEENEKNLNPVFPKLWYGWFGRGTKNRGWIKQILKKMLKNILKKLRKKFPR